MLKPFLKFAPIMIGIAISAIENYKSQPDSQQDKYLNEHIFRNKKNGFFVDIGAHDGETYSNTHFFEKQLGWKGICFEPLPGPFEKLQKNRSCICINACVSAVEGPVEFLQVADHPTTQQNMLSGMLHTYDPRHLQRLLKEIAAEGGSYKIVKMQSRQLNTVLKEYGIKHIDYLSIDIEGGELSVLESIDFNLVKIFAISIENNYGDSKIRKFLTDKSRGFKYITSLGGDEIYLNIHNKQ